MKKKKKKKPAKHKFQILFAFSLITIASFIAISVYYYLINYGAKQKLHVTN